MTVGPGEIAGRSTIDLPMLVRFTDRLAQARPDWLDALRGRDRSPRCSTACDVTLCWSLMPLLARLRQPRSTSTSAAPITFQLNTSNKVKERRRPRRPGLPLPDPGGLDPFIGLAGATGLIESRSTRATSSSSSTSRSRSAHFPSAPGLRRRRRRRPRAPPRRLARRRRPRDRQDQRQRQAPPEHDPAPEPSGGITIDAVFRST